MKQFHSMFGVCAAFLSITGGACDGVSPPPPLDRTTSQPVADASVAGPADASTPADGTVSVVPSAEVDAVKALTRDALAAWKRADVQGLMALSPEAVPTISSDGPRFAAMFGADSWRARVVAAWDGQIHAVRFDGTRALAHFATRSDGRLVLADVARENGAWRFQGIVAASAASFVATGSLAPAP